MNNLYMQVLHIFMYISCFIYIYALSQVTFYNVILRPNNNNIYNTDWLKTNKLQAVQV